MAIEADDKLTTRLAEVQGGKCFICMEPVALGGVEKLHIDHIIPKAKGGKDDENNYAVTHARCNLSKQDSDLRVARCMAKYEQLKERYADRGPNRPNLGDFLAEYGGAKHVARIRPDSGTVHVSLGEMGAKPLQLPLYTDKLSKMQSFYVELPIEYVFHDTRINPRAVGNRVRALVEEFLAGRPQLQPSLAWSDVKPGQPEAQVNIFDGQHKAVAQILLGARTVPLRIFVNPNLDTLLEANTRAGTTLRQVAFDKSVQRFLGSQIFAEKVEAFRAATGRVEGDFGFSEKQLVAFFKGEHREMRRYIADAVRSAVIHDPNNKLKDYVEFGGKGTDKPLSYSTVDRTFFTLFVYKDPLEVPMNYRLEVGENPRQLEKQQLIQLMNIFAEEVLIQFDLDRGSGRTEQAIRAKEDIPDGHLRAVRMTREEVLYNILRQFQGCAKRFFLMNGGKNVPDDELFQQRFPDLLWEHMTKVCKNIAALPIWVNKDPTMSSAVFGGKQTNEFWKQIFETGSTPSNIAVLAKPLNLDTLLQ